MYFFEKNILIYLKNKKAENLEDEPLKILKECINFLNYYIAKPDKIASKLKEIGKLYSLGYIRVFAYTFIKSKFRNSTKIIGFINGNETRNKNESKKENESKNENEPKNENESIYKMIRFYIYKILYNNYKIDVFINKETFDKFKLKSYKELKTDNLKNQLNNIFKIDKIKTLKNDYYEQSYKVINKYKEEEFKNKIKPKDFKFGIDNFYLASYNLILLNIFMDNSDINKDFYNNFYDNICEPLFKG